MAGRSNVDRKLRAFQLISQVDISLRWSYDSIAVTSKTPRHLVSQQFADIFRSADLGTKPTFLPFTQLQCR
jgi:hypothetical protein